MKLHDGLINTRQRRIRQDWKASFCRLMHWPQGSNIDRVDSADAVLILRDGSGLEPDDFSSEALADMLRAAVVYGVSALDRYIHERVVQNIVAALKRTPRTKQQEDFSIPVTTAIQITEAMSRARRAGQNVRPANEVRKKVQELLHQRPFQSWREVEYAFKLLGITNLAGQLQGAMGLGDISPVRNQLNQIVARRNHIVHEGDIVRHQRGGNLRPRELQPAFVNQSLDFLDDFVGHLEQVA
ncbi:hypothetical protein [Algiphilus sp.]|uniref:hypothetical protein n=1 Tax=Algiphilus sp. TaxID=1872431 RepID=UPI003B51C454